LDGESSICLVTPEGFWKLGMVKRKETRGNPKLHDMQPPILDNIKSANYSEILKILLTWIIHKPRLLQMRGTGCEAVVLHREYPVTKQMP